MSTILTHNALNLSTRTKQFTRELLLLVLVLCTSSATLLSQAPGTWLFGRHAVIDWKPGPVSQRLWPDTSQAAPGILWDGRGEPLIYKLENGLNLDSARNSNPRFGLKWFGGDTIASSLQRGNESFWAMGTIPDALLVRKPGSRDTIYSIQTHQNAGQVLTKWETLENGAVTAHTIDLSQKLGRGFTWVATDTLLKSFGRPGGTGLQPALRSAAASLAIVPHSNGRDLWVIMPLVFPSQLRTFRITPLGIDTSAITLNLTFPRGFFPTAPLEFARSEYSGELKVSIDGKRVAFSAGARGRIGLLDFDNATGQFSNEREISNAVYWRDDTVGVARVVFATLPYGIEFSPDGRFLYVTNIQLRGMGTSAFLSDVVLDSLRGELVQLDISLPTAEEIKASRTVIKPMSYQNWFGGMQLGPDGKIYVAQRERTFVSAITNPNARGAACGFVERAVELAPGSVCGEGFPFVMSTTLGAKAYIIAPDVCLGETAALTIGGGFTTDSVVWNFGDAFATTSQGYGRTGRHVYTRPGAYKVTATQYLGSEAQEPLTTWVYVYEPPVASAYARRPVACIGDTITLEAAGAPHARWYEGDSLIWQGQKLLYRPARTTTLRVVVSAFRDFSGCTDTTYITVNAEPAPTISFAGNSSSCIGDTVYITAGYVGREPNDVLTWTVEPHEWYQWVRKDTFLFLPKVRTSVRLHVRTVSGCVVTDSIIVTPNAPPTIRANADTVVCQLVPVVLQARGGAQYEWKSIGGGIVGTGSSVVVSPQTTTQYVVVGTDSNGCTGADTVTVTVLPGPALRIRGDTLSCDGQPITLTCEGAPQGTEASITWINDAGVVVGTGATLTIVPTANTTYRVASGGGAGCTDTARHYVRVGTSPVVTITPTDTVVCAGATIVATSSGGIVMNIVAQPGIHQYSITETDSVGCEGTGTITLRGVAPNAIVVAMRDTTVNISDGAAELGVHITSPTELRGTVLPTMSMRVTHNRPSLALNRFVVARTGSEILPTAQGISGVTMWHEIQVDNVTLTGQQEPLFTIEALPLITADTTSSIAVQVLSVQGLGLCTDSASHGGVLSITGCGMEYTRAITVGSAMSVAMYPNPAETSVHVTVDVGVIGPITITLVDALGRTLHTHSTVRTTTTRQTDTHTIDLHDVPSGVYHVLVSSPMQTEAMGLVRR